MEAIQLSLFSKEKETIPAKKQKKAKLGRYERIQRELEANDCDPYKIFIEVESQSLPKSDYTFVDLFCGAGGMTQGLSEAGFRPVGSVEINPIASATHTKNFPDCHHLCDDIKNLNPQKLGSSVLIVLIFQENAKEVMPVFQNLLNFSNQNHTFLIALI